MKADRDQSVRCGLGELLREEIAFIPARSLRRIGDALADQGIQGGDARCGRIVDRLVRIVAGAVIVLVQETVEAGDAVEVRVAPRECQHE